MIKQILVFVENQLGPLTLQSILDSVPDVELYVVPIVRSSLLDTYLQNHPEIYVLQDNGITENDRIYKIGQLMTEVTDDIVFCIRSGCVVHIDFLENGFVPEDIDDYQFGVSKTFMYKKHPKYDKYKNLGIDTGKNAFNTDVLFINASDPPQFKGTDSDLLADKRLRKVCMPYIMQSLPDPLVEQMLQGKDVLFNNVLAIQSAVLNYWNLAVRPDCTTVQHYAYPFDILGKSACRVRDFLSVSDYENIMKNAYLTKKYVAEFREVFRNKDVSNIPNNVKILRLDS